MKRLTLVCLALLSVSGCRATAPVEEPHPQDSGLQSWTSSYRSLRVGESLTVQVYEVVASSDQMNQRGGQSRGSSGSARGSVDGRSLPSPQFSTGIERGAESRSSLQRSQRFVADVPVRVVGKTDAGLLLVEGTRELRVDGTRRSLSVKGTVSPRDVSGSRLVGSHRLLDADIRYGGSGPITGGNPVMRLLYWIFPG